ALQRLQRQDGPGHQQQTIDQLAEALLIDPVMQVFTDQHAQHQQRDEPGQPGQGRNQLALHQQHQTQAGIEGKPDAEQGGPQPPLVQLGPGQGVDQQRTARGEQAVGQAGTQGQQSVQPRRVRPGRAAAVQAPEFTAGEPQHQYSQQSLEQIVRQPLLQGESCQCAEQHQRQYHPQQQGTVQLATMAQHQRSTHQHVQRHQYRQQLGDRQQQRTQGQGDDQTAEAGDGLHRIGEQDEQAYPQPGIHHGRRAPLHWAK